MERRLLAVLVAAIIVVHGLVAHVAAQLPDQFGIYVAELSGRNHRQIAASSWQQMSHPRVSPDLQWVTFTCYSQVSDDGLAREINGYEGTAIMLVRLDGRGMRTVIPAKPGVLNCNSSWIDGGRSLIWVSTDNASRIPWIMQLNFVTGVVSRVPTPVTFPTTDPHRLGDRVVFPVIGAKVDSLWLMNWNGSGCRQITFPSEPSVAAAGPHVGDYDPKFSPDGRCVAYMRLEGGGNWRVFLVDIDTGQEHNLSGANNVDIVPDWSSDGVLLVFSHIDTSDYRKMGLYTMRPDGSGRTLLPMPRGFVCNQPSFIPGGGSRSNARIVYQAMKVPGMP